MRPIQNGQELTLTRVLHAPRELVWKVWTDPKHLAQWWGPSGFTNPLCQVDLKINGQLRIDMRGPDGVTYPMDGYFKEITPPERLVFTSLALDDRLQPIFENLNTITFMEEGKNTKLTLHVRVLQITDGAEVYLKGMEQGWTLSLERLQETLSSLLGSLH
jgi:uncharacterized protein YndB with AHSA1/START domain